MFSGSRRVLACLCAATAVAYAAELRVCADPNNLPYSNQRGQGFENELARLAAHDLGRAVRFVWAPQHGRYLKNTLMAGRCDVVMGLPSGIRPRRHHAPVLPFQLRIRLAPRRGTGDPLLRRPGAQSGAHRRAPDAGRSR